MIKQNIFLHKYEQNMCGNLCYKLSHQINSQQIIPSQQLQFKMEKCNINIKLFQVL